MIDLGETNSVSGKNKLQDRTLEKMIKSLYDHLTRIKTISENLKDSNGKINIGKIKKP